MANNYLEFSAMLPKLSEDEEAWLKDQLAIVYVFGDEEYAEDAVPDNLASKDPDWIGCRAYRDMEDYDSDLGENAGFEYEFSGDNSDEDWGRHLWFRSAEYGNVAQVAHLVQKFLKQFAPNDSWSLTWATTCSKPRAGEFGGGAVFVTASDIKWNDAYEFVEQQAAAFAAAESSTREEGESSDTEGELEPQVRLDRLVAKLNLKDGDLDSIVRDVATEIATDINNAGVSRQLKYLVDELGIENAVESLQLSIRKEGKPTSRTLLTLEIEYDPSATDPEGLAAAMDRLMETACSTPGILDDYGTPTIGEFFVSTPAIDSVGSGPQRVGLANTVEGQPSYSLGIDGPEFRQQRELLQRLRSSAVSKMPYRPAPGEAESLEGLIELTDALADQAHDNYGVECLLDVGEGPCECEKPGHFCSGVPGILAHMENDRLAPGAKVERCDCCQRYATDGAALEKLRELGHDPP